MTEVDLRSMEKKIPESLVGEAAAMLSHAHGVQRIVALELFSGGQSGACTFLALFEESGLSKYRVVKIGKPEVLARELGQAKKLAGLGAWLLPLRPVPLAWAWRIRNTLLSALKLFPYQAGMSEYVNCGERDRATSLKELVKTRLTSGKVDLPCQIIRDLFNHLCPSFYHGANNRQVFFRELCPALIRETIFDPPKRDFAIPNFCAEERETQKLADPLGPLAQRVWREEPAQPHDYLQWGVCHGDLHPGNILVVLGQDERLKTVQLIDTETLKEGVPVFFDFAYLEIQVRAHCFADHPLLTSSPNWVQDWLQAEETLLQVLFTGRSLPIPAPWSCLQVVQAIRQATEPIRLSAADNPRWKRLYLYMLYLTSLKVLRIVIRHDKPAQEKRMIYLLAALYATWIEEKKWEQFPWTDSGSFSPASSTALPKIPEGSSADFAYFTPRPHFFGREEKMKQLATWLADPQARIFVLHAMGGVGKTTLLGRFLQQSHVQSGYSIFCHAYYRPGSSDCPGNFWYDLCLRWLKRDPSFPYNGLQVDTRAVYREVEASLAGLSSSILVLDGLERIQGDGGEESLGGPLRDQGLAELLGHVAAGRFPGLKLLITSRFEVEEIIPYQGNSAVISCKLQPLSPEAGGAFLQELNKRGTPEQWQEVAEAFGGHALTLWLVGKYLQRFAGGEPTAYRNLKWREELADPMSLGRPLAQEVHQFQHLLKLFEEKLSPSTKALLGWFAQGELEVPWIENALQLPKESLLQQLSPGQRQEANQIMQDWFVPLREKPALMQKLLYECVDLGLIDVLEKDSTRRFLCHPFLVAYQRQRHSQRSGEVLHLALALSRLHAPPSSDLPTAARASFSSLEETLWRNLWQDPPVPHVQQAH